MMTWNEFKKVVDEKLKEQDADPDKVRIFFIDVHMPSDGNDMSIKVGNEFGDGPTMTVW